MVSPQSKTTTYTYNAVGNRASVTNPNSTSTAYGYDDLNRLTSVTHTGPGGTIASYTYTLNDAGFRTEVVENGGSHVYYGYDSLYRLKSERRTGAHTDTMTYSYDPVGNRLTKAHRGVTTTYAYNNRDMLLSEWDGSDSTRYSYDSAGRTLTKVDAGGTTHYFWEDEDRLDSLHTPSTGVKYAYDADGRRVKEAAGGTVKQYLIDPLLPYGQVIAQTDGSDALVAEYIYGIDRVSQRRSGTSRYLLADGLGSIRMLTDSIGAVTDSNYYTAFGEDLYHSGSTVNDFKYVGEQLDPNSGFYYNRARWMDSRVGRFVSVDPFGGNLEAPISSHRYLYGRQNPVMFRDPTGKIFLSEALLLISFANIFGGGKPGPASEGYAGVVIGRVDWTQGTGSLLDIQVDITFKNTNGFSQSSAEYQQLAYSSVTAPNSDLSLSTGPLHDDNYSRKDDKDGKMNDAHFSTIDSPNFTPGGYPLGYDDDIDYTFTAQQLVLDKKHGNKVVAQTPLHTVRISGSSPRDYEGVPYTAYFSSP